MTRKTEDKNFPAKVPRTEEEYERMNIALAMRLSTERLRDGTASSQEILYWLKVGSPENQLQRNLLKGQIQLTDAKVEEIKGARRDSEIYEDALKAFKGYLPSNAPMEGEFTEVDD